jgi:tRNA A58 N-methylase Trm61
MIAATEAKPDDKVLEIGTGSGYGAAVLSRIAGKVYTIERHAALADAARQRFARLGYRNIEVRGPRPALTVVSSNPRHCWPSSNNCNAIVSDALRAVRCRSIDARVRDVEQAIAAAQAATEKNAQDTAASKDLKP